MLYLPEKTMKKIVSLFTALAFIFIIASCSKNPSKVLPKKDGKWNVTYTETEDGKQTDSGKGTLVFTETAFTLTDDALTGFSFAGTWVYDKGSENITITIFNDATVFRVSEMTRKSETWTNVDGNTTTVWKLTKP